MDQAVEVMTFLVLLGAALGAVVLIFRGVRGVFRFFSKINRFFGDWYGSEPADGHPRVKGVLHRLDDLESLRLSDSETLGEIKDQVVKELNRNGGSSAKDAAFEAVRVSQETLEAVQGVQLQMEAEVLERKHWTEAFEADARKQRRAMQKLVLRMIHEKPADQEAIWKADSQKWVDGVLEDGENVD